MKPQIPVNRTANQIREALAGLMELKPEDLEILPETDGADVVIRALGKTFVIDLKKSTSSAQMAEAAKNVLDYSRRLKRIATPVLAVPFMGDAGRTICEKSGVSWFDLSGNAHITASGLRIKVGGLPNRFRSAGRPPNIFAPKSSRVARWLLIHHGKSLTQREIARGVNMDEGFVSRIVSRMEQEGYIVREDVKAKSSNVSKIESRSIRVRDPQLFLDAWRERYRFNQHPIFKGHVAARSGDALLQFVTDTLKAQGIVHAATGLAGAWALTHFASFRTATVFIDVEPTQSLFEKLSFRDDSQGANLWLAVPNDSGVFHGATPKDGIPCVHPVQVYMDLKEHPERASEAAQQLREQLLTWSPNA